MSRKTAFGEVTAGKTSKYNPSLSTTFRMKETPREFCFTEIDVTPFPGIQARFKLNGMSWKVPQNEVWDFSVVFLKCLNDLKSSLFGEKCDTVTMVCINLGNSLESTRNHSPSEERFNFFDAELLQMFAQNKGENVLISPISIKILLGMLMEGAADKTADEIRTALRLPQDERETRKQFNTWLSVLQVKNSPNTLNIATRVFTSHRYVVNPTYEEILKKYYSGGVTKVNFEDAKETSRLINNWVGNQTRQHISSIVEEGQITSDNTLMLANAVYFKGFWSTPFVPERTATRCFYSKKNQCTDSLMMMETGYFDYGYVNRLDAKAIALPYKGEKFSTLLLLPSKTDGLELLIRDLMHISLKSVLADLKEQEVFVQIPQFEISHNVDLVESLKNVKIVDIFSNKANLSKMFTTELESLAVSKVYHSAKIVVNEEGSEGAAATGALFVPLMGGTTTSFVANHPFLFFVLNLDKNSILFAGKVTTPQKSKALNKEIHSLKSPKITSKKQNPLGATKNPLAPQIITTQTNSPAAFTKENESSIRTLHKPEYQQRRQQAGPKLRSIKPAFSESGTNLPISNEREISNESSEIFNGPSLQVPIRKALGSHSIAFFQKETHGAKKRGKTVQEISKNRKREDLSSDDWRHHVLLFT